MNLIVLGPPGAGKGTQCVKVAKSFDLVQLSTGEMLRSEVESRSELGIEVKNILDMGDLVPDDMVISMLSNRMDSYNSVKGFIFDGFPRTTAQASALDKMLVEKHQKMDHVIQLEVDEAAIIERLSGRFSCSRCGAGYHNLYKKPKVDKRCDICGAEEFSRRSDDNPETVRSRLVAYREQTAPILPFYEDKGILKYVNGMKSMNEVFDNIKEILSGR